MRATDIVTRFLWTFFAVFVLVVATIAGAAPLDPSGSEAAPELVDDEGDVEYSDTYTGPPHEYLDVLALWLEYNNATDHVEVTLKTVETETLESPPDGFTISCGWALWVTLDGEDNGRFSFEWRVSGLDGEETTSLRYLEPQASGYSLSESAVPIPHTYERQTDAPGYHQATVERDAVLPYADAVNNVYAECEEYREPIGGFGFENMDDGSTAAHFDFVGLERAPVNTTADEFMTPGSPEPTSTTSAESVAVGLAASAAAVLVAFAWRRRSA